VSPAPLSHPSSALAWPWRCADATRFLTHQTRRHSWLLRTIAKREYVFFMIPNVSGYSANGVGRISFTLSAAYHLFSPLSQARGPLCKSPCRSNGGVLSFTERSSTLSLIARSCIILNITCLQLCTCACSPPSHFPACTFVLYRALLLMRLRACCALPYSQLSDAVPHDLW
jgi:hypothetical protein